AIRDDGRLLLVEAIIPDDDSPHPAKDLDIRLITLLPGGGRTESEYARLLATAGFLPQPASGLAGTACVLVAIPASWPPPVATPKPWPVSGLAACEVMGVRGACELLGQQAGHQQQR